jgi:putative nucleotide binding protein
MTDEHDSSGEVVVLDYLPFGRPDDDRPRDQTPTLVHALGGSFALLECTLSGDRVLEAGDRLELEGELVASTREIEYDDLTSNARDNLRTAVESVVDADERRFVDFYNDAQPITTRLHSLDLLPGIGKKLRNNVLDERKRGPFESFADVKDRVAGLHNPREVIVDRVMEELREEELKYRSFAR